MVGYLIGGIVFGSLSDKIGRKPTFMLANMFLLLSGLLGAIAPNYECFLASRFIVGFSIVGVESSCFVMGMELVGPSKRTQAGILCWFFETGGLLSAVGLAYLVRDNWRKHYHSIFSSEIWHFSIFLSRITSDAVFSPSIVFLYLCLGYT